MSYLVSTLTSHLAGREAKLRGKEVHEVIIAQAGRGQTLLPLSVRGSGAVLGYLKSLVQLLFLDAIASVQMALSVSQSVTIFICN